MDLYIVRMDSGFISTPLTGGKSLKTEQRRNSIKPYYFGAEYEVIEFDLQLALLDNNFEPLPWTPERKMKIGQWLFQNTYKPFQTIDDLGKIYYGIFTAESTAFTINEEGYLEVTFTTNSYCAWSPVITSVFDLWNNPVEGTIIEVENLSNYGDFFAPKLQIEMKEDDEYSVDHVVTIENLSNNNQLVTVSKLRYNEIIGIDNENRLIKSANPLNLNPYENFNKEWLTLVKGVNQLKITGKCKITIQAQFPLIR